MTYPLNSLWRLTLKHSKQFFLSEEKSIIFLSKVQPISNQIKMSPKWMLRLRKYFHLMGFPSTLCGSVYEKTFNFIILAIHIGFGAWCSVCAFESFIDELALMELLDALNFFLYYTFSVVTYWIIIYDSHTKQRAENAFWTMFERSNDGVFSQCNVEMWSYLSPLICLLSADILSSIMAILFEQTSEFFTKIMTFTIIWIYDNRIFFYFLHLKVIAVQLRKIEIEIKRLQINFTKKRLEWIRHHYKLLHGMCEMVNTTFGLSNLASLLLSFHCAVTFLNFIYRQMHRKFHRFNMVWTNFRYFLIIDDHWVKC